ncbi:uncharacterized protein LOC108906430 [Anoplophora glabripennis]|uniref:uncharacterized protein LOC108906430 n=1 Tax=Anoplophora glabripennis TaxID=217634 RepID=UPI00087434FF|nr:uncharacterized protein LOC108906430 [Anoplophora glabripennis]
MLWISCAIILTSFTLVQAGQTTGIVPVRFVRSNRKIESSTTKPLQRSARSYGDLTIDVAVWTEPTVPFIYAKPNSFGFSFEENGYVTPDFSNGLEYPDPLLLTGLAAKRAVRYLYSRELFFGDIPHIRALLRNQEERRSNGLPGNRLGSLREQSPFLRLKKHRRLQNHL